MSFVSWLYFKKKKQVFLGSFWRKKFILGSFWQKVAFRRYYMIVFPWLYSCDLNFCFTYVSSSKHVDDNWHAFSVLDFRLLAAHKCPDFHAFVGLWALQFWFHSWSWWHSFGLLCQKGLDIIVCLVFIAAMHNFIIPNKYQILK